MLKKCGSAVLLLWMVSVLILPAEASGQQGTVRITPVWCGQAVSGGLVSVSRIGEKSPEGIVLTDGLADWVQKEEELFGADNIGWLAQTFGTETLVCAIEEETGACFQNLEKGIYLVRQTEASPGYFPFQPFLLTLPDKGSWMVCREPEVVYDGESPRTGDRPAPIIGAMGVGLSVAVLMVLVDEKRK